MNNIKISNTNASGTTKTAVRVRIGEVLVSELREQARNPLSILQARTRSKYHAQLCSDLDLAMNDGLCSSEQAEYIKSYIFPLIRG